MSELRFVEVDPTTVPTPPAGGKTVFVDDTSHQVSIKDESGTVTPITAAGLTVGGALTGTLPDPGLAATAVTAAAYGSATTVPTFTVGVDGRLTAALGVLIAIPESQVTSLVSDLALKAPLASPTFTGTPAAPTAAGGTNTTQLATTAFVTTAVAGGGAVSSVFTRTGAVVATSGDYSVAQVTGAAPLASPTFTGTPAAPTATAGTNTTQLATTAYADNAVAKQAEAFMLALSDEVTGLSTGTAVITFRMPFACSMTALPRANVNTVSSSGLPTFNIKKNGTTIFSTNLTIDVSEKTSVTAATAAVLSSSPTTFADDDEITVDITVAGTGTKGAKITLNVVRT